MSKAVLEKNPYLLMSERALKSIFFFRLFRSDTNVTLHLQVQRFPIYIIHYATLNVALLLDRLFFTCLCLNLIFPHYLQSSDLNRMRHFEAFGVRWAKK